MATGYGIKERGSETFLGNLGIWGSNGIGAGV
jgi:hypothetical protein